MFHATTILAYRGKNCSVIGGDGQVTAGHTVLKSTATKIRKIGKDGKVLAGFAGSTADAFNLFEMFESCLDASKGDLLRAAIEFSKEWRKDKYLRKLEAMMLVLDREHIFLLSGVGDVVEPDDERIAAIGSGGNYALSAARALDKFGNLNEKELVKESLKIAGEICIYTNSNIKTLSICDKESNDANS
ncbi:MAG: ATP-dependent protease subunit HslV [Campylobacter sp.]|nr:ATP-dependent protease subunit HslV [Campylobacter sp.]